MDVHVDEPGQQGLACQIDLLGACRNLDGRERTYLLDATVIADQDRRILHVLSGRDIEHAVGGHERRGTCGRRKRSSSNNGQGKRTDHLESPKRKRAMLW